MKSVIPVLLLLGAPVYAQSGEELFDKGQYAQAAAEFERLPDAAKSPSTFHLLGMSYHLLGRFKEAQEGYDRSIKADPDQAVARNNLGALFYSQRMFADADREFRRAADHDGENATLTANLHWARYARDNVRDARQQADDVATTRRLLLEPVEKPGGFLAVVSLMPPTMMEEAAARAMRGDIFTARKLYEDAVIEYKRSVAIDRYDASVTNRLGIAYHHLRKYRDSEQKYREALRLRPNHLDAINNLGVIDYIRGDFASALSRYKAGLRLKPNSVSILRNMGASLFALERWEEGILAYQQALALKPDLFEPQPAGAGAAVQMNQQQTALMNFYLAKVFALQGNTDAAISYLFKAVESGFADLKLLQSEEAFKRLVADERFERVMKTITDKKSGND